MITTQKELTSVNDICITIKFKGEPYYVHKLMNMFSSQMIWGNNFINRMLLGVSDGQSRVCAEEKCMDPRVRDARRHGVKVSDRHSLPTWGAAKSSVVLRTVSKEPGEKQGSKRNLNPWIKNGIILRREKPTEGKVNPFLTTLCSRTQAEASRWNFQPRTPRDKSLVSWFI